MPPFFQGYEELRESPPHWGPYAGVRLDEQDRWTDHDRFAIDGPGLHRDENDPGLPHADLLSYERHGLVAHVLIQTGASTPRSR